MADLTARWGPPWWCTRPPGSSRTRCPRRRGCFGELLAQEVDVVIDPSTLSVDSLHAGCPGGVALAVGGRADPPPVEVGAAAPQSLARSRGKASVGAAGLQPRPARRRPARIRAWHLGTNRATGKHHTTPQRSPSTSTNRLLTESARIPGRCPVVGRPTGCDSCTDRIRRPPSGVAIAMMLRRFAEPESGASVARLCGTACAHLHVRQCCVHQRLPNQPRCQTGRPSRRPAASGEEASPAGTTPRKTNPTRQSKRTQRQPSASGPRSADGYRLTGRSGPG